MTAQRGATVSPADFTTRQSSTRADAVKTRPHVRHLRTERLVALACNNLQEAQLSQRYRAMLPVTKYFAKSLKITQAYSK